MNEQLIDVNLANRWLLEYRKFLTMAMCSGSMISPSEQVDQVWHLHMTYTQDYRAMTEQLLGKPFMHEPSGGGSKDGEKFENIYEETMKFYKELFLEKPPSEIWESTQERFDQKNFSYIHVNFYRLAVLYSLKAKNPEFLAPPTYKN